MFIAAIATGELLALTLLAVAVIVIVILSPYDDSDHWGTM